MCVEWPGPPTVSGLPVVLNQSSLQSKPARWQPRAPTVVLNYPCRKFPIFIKPPSSTRWGFDIQCPTRLSLQRYNTEVVLTLECAAESWGGGGELVKIQIYGPHLLEFLIQ